MKLARFTFASPSLIAGVMSGTSLDGIDVAFVTLDGSQMSDARIGAPALTLRSFHTEPIDSVLKSRLLDLCAGNATVRELGALHVELGRLYADAIRRGAEAGGIEIGAIDAVGLHGQTVWHDPRRKPEGITMQIGSGAIVAEALGTAVVDDFRSADVAAGGEGAPLVPLFDLTYLASPDRSRAVVNIGGIANVTWLPRGVAAADVIAFDTGPGNGMIDAAMRQLYGKEYDEGGACAASGTVIPDLLMSLIADPWLAAPPPKSTGRERYGEEQGRKIAEDAVAGGAKPHDVIATLTMFTAITIADAIDTFCAKGEWVDDIVLCGGGALNRTLRANLEARSPGTTVISTDDLGIPADAKEAICFAFLAWSTLCGRPGNLPSVTGAERAVVLGAVRGRRE